MDITLMFKYYYRSLCLYAIHFVLDISLAEDIVQGCFVNFIEKQITVRDISNVRSYLFTSVRNECIKYLRCKKSS